ncbi:hypothetical protein AVEN_221948-1 [Araneus ventricosus]|uniref:Uncharacterized protein n=1 Tax=Araneus ventricosus TaxID=182803 RepID=A0A4Y2F7N8_ARAVE|nr:hypothetical protein AVEN_221948-1 [Araneus ventricosus]
MSKERISTNYSINDVLEVFRYIPGSINSIPHMLSSVFTRAFRLYIKSVWSVNFHNKLSDLFELEEEAGEQTYNHRTLLAVISQRECDNVLRLRLASSSEQFPNRNA